MGEGPLRRRDLLAHTTAAAAAALLAGCGAHKHVDGGWVGASVMRGHRLRGARPGPAAGPAKRADVLIVGGGIAGLACARALAKAGIDDIALLELEDSAGGNARGHAIAGHGCPLGAHYLPVPTQDDAPIYELCEELGLVRQQSGRAVWDERHLCHSLQERLFFKGDWIEGLLPPAQTEVTRQQYLHFAHLVEQAQREDGFAVPTHRAPWTDAHTRLDAVPFSNWLDYHGLGDKQLRWYLDYCCRDDYGAPASQVSAWAGLHYFASRHGFHPPGEGHDEAEPVLTWPEGNGWLAARLAEPLAGRIHAGRTVLRVDEGRDEVNVLAFGEAQRHAERWVARRVVFATPLFVADRLLAGSVAPLHEAARTGRHAPWLVANLLLDDAPLERKGTPRAWDNVVYGAASGNLGYVDASHQQLSPAGGPLVLTAYLALDERERPALLQQDWRAWLARVLDGLHDVHPTLGQQLVRADLARWGHGMSIPFPGRRASAALAALRQPQGRLHFAHSDLSAYSVFEEAYTQGLRAAQEIVRLDRR